MNYSQKVLKDAHKHASHNKDGLAESYLCACFHCCTLFAIEKVTKWTDEASEKGPTALCPVCNVDAVLGNRSGEMGSPVHDPAFVRELHQFAFGATKKTKKTKKE